MLLERSEPSLYAIHQELKDLLRADTALEPVLGSAIVTALVERLFREQAVSVVFHAAAYKYVPLVKANPLAGLANMCFPTAWGARRPRAAACVRWC